jgi:dTDP-4-dehydrorhamnose 3,5-epimerase
MHITPTALDGVVIVDVERHEDARGFFARTFCAEEFVRAGMPVTFVQCNTSFNRRRGTLRGLHCQDEPYPEGKLVRCTRGAAFDVAVDIRAGSTTFRSWVGVELSAENTRAVWIPSGFAHGFVTLSKNTELSYQLSEFYHPDLSRGWAWNDPAFAIEWPIAEPIISSRDAAHLSFAP